MRFPDGTVVADRADRLGEAEVTDFFRRPVAAHAVQGPWSDAISAYVGKPVELLRCDHEGDAVDVLPLTVISTASVEDLARAGRIRGLPGQPAFPHQPRTRGL